MRTIDLAALASRAAAMAICLASAGFAAPAIAPKPIGDAREAIRISADSILRWPSGNAIALEMRGNARVDQGNNAIAAPRLMAWFEESRRNGSVAGVLEVYAEAGATLYQDGQQSMLKAPVILRYTTTCGLALSGQRVLSGEAPADDAFRARARAARGQERPQLPDILKDGALADIRPSAEQITVTEASEKGATITLLGNAEVAAEDFVLAADAIRLRVAFGEEKDTSPHLLSIYAEGAVDLRRARERMTAQAVYLDWPAEEGLALDARIRSTATDREVPIQFYAGAVRELSRYRFSAEGKGYLTTSRVAEPHYRLEASDIEMVRGPGPRRARRSLDAQEKAGTFSQGPLDEPKLPEESLVVSARNNVFYIESAPVLYWPYVAKDVRTGAFLIKSVELGSSDNLGSFLRLEWDLYDLGLGSNEWSELTLRTDGYTDRGLGIGLDLAYKQKERLGFMRSYYIHDTAEEDDRGLPTPRDDRGEFTWRHREILGGGWQGDVEIGWLSDRRFLRTYDRRAYDEDKDRESQVFVSRTVENSMLTLISRARMNEFQNQVERQSVAYHIIGEPIGGSPLLWTSHTELCRLQLETDEGLGLPSTDPVVRFDTAHEISWPFQLGPVRADPYIWGDITVFSERADDEGSTLRGATAYGLRLASNFYRTWQTQCQLLRLDRLRHVVSPTVEYTNVWAVSREPEDFIQHDETDALDEMHRITLGVRNRLQTYRPVEGRTERVDFLVADIDYALHLKHSDALMERDDYVEASLQWQATENIEINSMDNRYNTERGRFEGVNGQLVLKYWRPLRLALGYKYYLDLSEPGSPAHSVGLFRVAYQPPYSRWRLEVSTAYDFNPDRKPTDKRDPQRLGSGLFLTRNLDGWDFTIGAQFNQGRRNESILTFDVAPPGISREPRSQRSPYRM